MQSYTLQPLTNTLIYHPYLICMLWTKRSDETIECVVDNDNADLILGDLVLLCIGCNLIILFLE
jgi:hypothetical protein